VDAASRALEPGATNQMVRVASQHVVEAFTPMVGYHHIVQHPPQVLIGDDERVGVEGSRMRPSATDFDAQNSS